ncbi:heterokaryon incompatibility, partial [Fusarium beomiforme]
MITYHLGFRYLWIDCLCIIQGNSLEARRDWEEEAKKMTSVYSNATCTIASTGSASSSGGCFHKRNTLSLQPCKVGIASLDSLTPQWIYARRDDVFDFERSIDSSPLNVREWVLQERLLLRHILHVGAEMIYWECCLRSASELNPSGHEYKKCTHDFKDNYFPNIAVYIKTRTEVELAHREGRGFQ